MFCMSDSMVVSAASLVSSISCCVTPADHTRRAHCTPDRQFTLADFVGRQKRTVKSALGFTIGHCRRQTTTTNLADICRRHYRRKKIIGNISPTMSRTFFLRRRQMSETSSVTITIVHLPKRYETVTNLGNALIDSLQLACRNNSNNINKL